MGVSELQLGLMALPVLLLLLFLRVPLAAAMFLVGALGSYLVLGSHVRLLSQLKTLPYGIFSDYSFSIIPLFLLMGQFAAIGGMSQALFNASSAWLGHRRGGVAMSAIGASAGFGAICGSSLATASTMGQVALPELKRAGYSGALASGTLAAGGTLGILIPPSVVLVIYALLAEVNIKKLFAAALVPGLLAALGYMLAVRLYLAWKPGEERLLPRKRLGERLAALVEVWPVLLVFAVVIGGLYLFSWFSPTPAAAVGAAGTGLIALFKGRLNWERLSEALLATAKTSGMIFLIILGADVFNSFLSLTRLPQEAASVFAELSLSPWLVLSGMLLLYLVLGMVMDSLAMILLTVPIFFPIVVGLDFGLSPTEVGLWFGVLVLVAAEVGLITPPVGLNLFVIKAMDSSISIAETYRGVVPYVFSDLVRIVLLVAVPGISLGLVRLLF